ncbi:MAG TPA: plastocyanin/azurin family copper-binding protein [Actinomycetota bacterium]|nr:plastocyanin/azurin family copper-binding protein [Actinomycetota bacterium]
MLRVARKALPLGLLFVLLAQTTAHAATVGISIVSSPSPGAYSPSNASLIIGDTAQWTNNSNNIHSATGDSPLSFWDTGTFTNGQSRSKQFVAAGTYTYHCSVHSSMHGTVSVKMTVSPTSGTTSTVFTVSWASATIPTGYNVDVQYSRNGGAFTNLLVNQTGSSISIQRMAPAPGTYQLRARIQNTNSGAASGYSSPVTVVVS